MERSTIARLSSRALIDFLKILLTISRLESSTDNWATTTTEYTGNAYQSLTKTALAPVGHQVKYRLKVTCTNSGLTTTSNEVTFTSVKEYCTPSYTSTDYYTSAFSTSVNGTTQTNYTATSQTGTNGYNDLSGDVSYNTIQVAGGSFDFTHTFAGNFFPGDNRLIIWIDWNDDGTFEDDADERVFNNYTGIMSTQVTQTGTITIPTGTPVGSYRMRVRCQWGDISTTPCIERVYGQALDFTLVVNASSSCIVNIPDVAFKAYLVGNTAINTNGDNEIQCDEAEAFTGSMFPIFQGITDMTGIEAFVNMTDLYCGFNQITTLDLSSNTQLEMLYCQNNQITDLNITGLTSLTYLFCSDNQLATLDLSTNTALESLLCYTNELTNLDVSNNVNLSDLMCFGNQLSVLDLSNNINLQYLACEDNELTTLDLSNNTDLEYLRCNNNQITALDLSSHPNLTDLQCQFNQLSSLNVKNGSNTGIVVFNSIANSSLSCIEVDDVAYSTTTWTAVDAWSIFSEDCAYAPYCIVNIPDANFKAYLVGNTAINTNGDTEIQCDEAEAFTGSMFPIFQGITDMTGVEAFVNMTNLYCGFNQITTLDLSSNTQLEMLYCQNNEITDLNITGLTNLTYLFCSDNQLATLDLSTNTALESLLCYTNELTNLDISNNVNLTDLMCFGNQLSVLDLSNNINLKYLACEDNQLTTLDLSNNTDLEYLRCNNNQITALDLSSHPNLTDLQCQFNQLASLNVKNGNNTDIVVFNSIANTSLTCIEVDDVAYSTTTWTAVDAWSTFSENCTVSVKDIANPISITVYPNPVNDMLHFSSNQPIENVTVSNMLGQQINVSVSSDNKSLDMSNLPTGNYFVKVTIEGIAKMIKVVKR